MSAAWTKYKNFNKFARTDGVSVNDFIAEFDKEYILAKNAGCVYSDIILAFRLLEASNMSEVDEKFVLTGVDYQEAKTKKNLFDQVKLSLKKFQGREMVCSSDDVKMKFDPSLVASIAQVLVSQGWKKPGPPGRKRSNTDPGLGDKDNKQKKNPVSKTTGKILTCFKCQSEYHMRDRCPKNKQNNDNKNDGGPSRELNLLTLAGTSTPQDEVVMVTENEEQLCLLVDEAGVRAVVDCACSKTVAGTMFIARYISTLSDEMKQKVEDVDVEPGKGRTIYQFGGGEQRASLRIMNLPAQIGDTQLTNVGACSRIE